MANLEQTVCSSVVKTWKCSAANAYITGFCTPATDQCPSIFAASVDVPKQKARGVYVFDAHRLQELHALNVNGVCAPTDLTFLAGSSSAESLLLTAGADSAARLWDLRVSNSRAQKAFNLPETVVSVTGDVFGRVFACAAGSEIHAFDLAGGQQAFLHSDAHSEPISRIRFHPKRYQELISAGDDGLLCALDTHRCVGGAGAGSARDDDDAGLRLVINNEVGIRSFTLIGEDAELLCAISTTEVMQLWSLHPKRPGALCGRYANLRSDAHLQCGDSDGYIVDVLYDKLSGCAHVLAGSVDGNLAFFHLNLEDATFTGHLGQGHSGLVRAAVCLGNQFATGAEDGTICIWSQCPSTGALTPKAGTTSKAASTEREARSRSARARERDQTR